MSDKIKFYLKLLIYAVIPLIVYFPLWKQNFSYISTKSITRIKKVKNLNFSHNLADNADFNICFKKSSFNNYLLSVLLFAKHTSQVYEYT